MKYPQRVYVTFDNGDDNGKGRPEPTGVTSLRYEAQRWVGKPEEGWEGDAYGVYQLVEVIKPKRKKTR